MIKQIQRNSSRFPRLKSRSRYVSIEEEPMSRQHNIAPIVPLKELNLTNRFLFDVVMEDPQTQQDVLSIIFGREIPALESSPLSAAGRAFH